jgi:hypothetical protein
MRETGADVIYYRGPLPIAGRHSADPAAEMTAPGAPPRLQVRVSCGFPLPPLSAVETDGTALISNLTTGAATYVDVLFLATTQTVIYST